MEQAYIQRLINHYSTAGQCFRQIICSFTVTYLHVQHSVNKCRTTHQIITCKSHTQITMARFIFLLKSEKKEEGFFSSVVCPLTNREFVNIITVLDEGNGL